MPRRNASSHGRGPRSRPTAAPGPRRRPAGGGRPAGTPRLLLVEFLRQDEQVHRHAKSMLFPFLLGCARARAVPARWVCLGAAIPCVVGRDAGRSRQVEMPAADWAALFAAVAAHRPTHVISSDELPPAMTRRLLASPGLARYRVMTEQGGWSDGNEPKDAFPPDERRRGWFTAWLGLADDDPAAYLLESAAPDYGAVLANAAARAAATPITILGGHQCSNRRRIRANPIFDDVTPAGDPRAGCSFCGFVDRRWHDERTDSLDLAEQQLRRLQATAGREGRGGRDRGTYDIFDIGLLLRFDDFFARVLRLGLPPSTFLFCPRIDDLVHAAARIEATLPALQAAGHRVRAMSMGIENFSAAENARFNKGITVAQVDALIALADRWDAAFPGVFTVFKGASRAEGRGQLGFILFTPWTTLADVRENLRLAAARSFPPHGYWLYSALQLKPNAPITALARRDGLLGRRREELGQLYGAVVTGAEVQSFVPWRFRDARVARLFHVLSRVGASHRDGAASPVFADDADFHEYHALLAALERRRPTTLALAEAMIELLDGPAPPRTGTALLRAALAAAGDRGAAPAPAQAPGAPPPPAAPASAAVPDTPADLEPLRAALERAVRAAAAPAPPPAGAPRVVAVWRDPRDATLGVAVSVAGRPLRLAVAHAAPDAPAFAVGANYAVTYARATPPQGPDDEAIIRVILQVCEARRPLDRAAPRGVRRSPGRVVRSQGHGAAEPAGPRLRGRRPPRPGRRRS
jgi:hypothetical protein